MREYVLTDREKEIITTFLEKGQRLEGYSVLISRCLRLLPKLEKDLELLKKFQVRALAEKAAKG